jgi:hypothetical protein
MIDPEDGPLPQVVTPDDLALARDAIHAGMEPGGDEYAEARLATTELLLSHQDGAAAAYAELLRAIQKD